MGREAPLIRAGQECALPNLVILVPVISHTSAQTAPERGSRVTPLPDAPTRPVASGYLGRQGDFEDNLVLAAARSGWRGLPGDGRRAARRG